MNYKKIYDSIIDRAKNRQITGYVERHHIIPRCMGGDDTAVNLVNLTAREHFIAHLLLVRIYPGNYKLIYAVNMMCLQFTEERCNNRRYEWIRKRLSDASSKMNSGINNPFYGKTHSLETRLKISEKAKDRKYIKTNKPRKTPIYAMSREEITNKAVETRKANGYKHSDETKKKIADAKSNVSQETKDKISKSNKGRKLTESQKQNLSKIRKGKPAWNKGVSPSEETISKRRDAIKGVPKRKTICPHCKKEGGIAAMTRHHFDNCKHIK
jgi:hypothetical protein